MFHPDAGRDERAAEGRRPARTLSALPQQKGRVATATRPFRLYLPLALLLSLIETLNAQYATLIAALPAGAAVPIRAVAVERRALVAAFWAVAAVGAGG